MQVLEFSVHSRILIIKIASSVGTWKTGHGVIGKFYSPLVFELISLSIYEYELVFL